MTNISFLYFKFILSKFRENILQFKKRASMGYTKQTKTYILDTKYGVDFYIMCTIYLLTNGF